MGRAQKQTLHLMRCAASQRRQHVGDIRLLTLTREPLCHSTKRRTAEVPSSSHDLSDTITARLHELIATERAQRKSQIEMGSSIPIAASSPPPSPRAPAAPSPPRRATPGSTPHRKPSDPTSSASRRANPNRPRGARQRAQRPQRRRPWAGTRRDMGHAIHRWWSARARSTRRPSVGSPLTPWLARPGRPTETGRADERSIVGLQAPGRRPRTPGAHSGPGNRDTSPLRADVLPENPLD
jgi:hypothetical protein